MRLTTNKMAKEMNMLELAHNCCFAKERKAMYRDYDEIIDAREFARRIIRIQLLERPDDEIFKDDEVFDEFMNACLGIPPENPIGLVALFYRNLWAQADLYERLKTYEEGEVRGIVRWLPVVIGEVVYTNFSPVGFYMRKDERPYECRVVFIGLNTEDPFMNVEYKEGRMWQFYFDEIGKKVFKSKIEAEEALRKMEGK